MEERIMKKLLAIFLSLALLYFLSACGGCGGTSLTLITGREFYVESLEAE